MLLVVDLAGVQHLLKSIPAGSQEPVIISIPNHPHIVQVNPAARLEISQPLDQSIHIEVVQYS